jgi:Flp pilus assembly protein TadG
MKNNLSKLSNDKGVTAVIVALLMIVFLGIAALVVDIGYNVMAKNQLQNAADAAALAGARQLGELYLNKAEDNPLSDINATLVDASARDTAKANKAERDSLVDANLTIKIGTWDPQDTHQNPDDTLHFNQTLTRPNAVQVNARKGNISTFFARIFGKDMMISQVVATAALSAMCEGNPSPIGISADWLNVTSCGSTINWNSTQTSCAGWTTLNVSKQDLDNKIYPTETDVLIGLMGGRPADDTTTPKTAAIPPINLPKLTAGTTTNFTGGSLGNEIFDAINYVVALHGGAWTTTVVVYFEPRDTENSCYNTSGDLPIVGLAKATIYGANATAKSINAIVDCNYTDPERGCGTEYENKYVYGSIPALVQ